jgi:hypothetical protein
VKAAARRSLGVRLTMASGLTILGCALGCTAGPIDVATLSSGGLTSGLVGHWTFDEGSGLLANDSSGNGRTGTISGPSWSWIAGRFGSALHFGGADQVSIPGLPPATDSYSVAAWLFFASSDVGGPSSIANVLNTETPAGGWALYATLYPSGYTGYEFRYWVGPPLEYEMTSPMPCNCLILDTWVHLAAVLDGRSSSLTMYVNGTVEKSVSATAGITPGSATLDIGRAQAPGFPLTGSVDDVAIYDRALVPEEVAQLAQGPAPDPQ